MVNNFVNGNLDCVGKHILKEVEDKKVQKRFEEDITHKRALEVLLIH